MSNEIFSTAYLEEKENFSLFRHFCHNAIINEDEDLETDNLDDVLGIEKQDDHEEVSAAETSSTHAGAKVLDSIEAISLSFDGNASPFNREHNINIEANNSIHRLATHRFLSHRGNSEKESNLNINVAPSEGHKKPVSISTTCLDKRQQSASAQRCSKNKLAVARSKSWGYFKNESDAEQYEEENKSEKRERKISELKCRNVEKGRVVSFSQINETRSATSPLAAKNDVDESIFNKNEFDLKKKRRPTSFNLRRCSLPVALRQHQMSQRNYGNVENADEITVLRLNALSLQKEQEEKLQRLKRKVYEMNIKKDPMLPALAPLENPMGTPLGTDKRHSRRKSYPLRQYQYAFEKPEHTLRVSHLSSADDNPKANLLFSCVDEGQTKGHFSQKSVENEGEASSHFANKKAGFDLASIPSEVRPKHKNSKPGISQVATVEQVSKLLSRRRSESDQLKDKMKRFLEKPNPLAPPPSLRIKKTNISIALEKTFARNQAEVFPVAQRKKTGGVVNLQTCPNLNVFTDQSWLYQDEKNRKCRYLREVPSPIPPIEEIFRD